MKDINEDPDLKKDQNKNQPGEDAGNEKYSSKNPDGPNSKNYKGGNDDVNGPNWDKKSKDVEGDTGQNAGVFK
jgi:hypothetical protein